MKFFFPDSQDQIYPHFDFQTETWPAHRVRQRDDLYAHEVFTTPPYAGILVSRSVVDGDANGGARRYSMAQRHRMYRVGVHQFFRLDREKDQRLQAMGDCGAFSYLKEETPPYTVDEVIDFYEECGFDAGVSVDHIIPIFRSELDQPTLFEEDAFSNVPEEWVNRQEITLNLADDFFQRHRKRRCGFVPIGVAQGWSPRSYSRAVTELQKMGYRRIGLGGLVPISNKPQLILECARAVSKVREPGTSFHLFGVGVALTDHMDELAAGGVESFDSTSPFLQAFKDARNNYYAASENFLAIRVPQVDGNPKLRRLIQAGEIDQTRAFTLERRVLDALFAFDKGDCPTPNVLAALAEYSSLLKIVTPMEAYGRILKRRPWKKCPCEVCRDSGINVMIFRGTERNKRRGFHNLYVFNQGIPRE